MPPDLLLRSQFPQALHHLLCADPRDRDRLELPGHGFVGLCDQPVHRKVPSWEGHVSWSEGEGRAEVVGSVPHVEDPLERAPALLRPACHVVPDDHLLAHVVGTPLAVVGVEGAHHQPAILVEGGWVGEDPMEELARAGASQPGLDEEGVGVRHEHHLKVLRGPVTKELKERGHAGGGGDLLHHAPDVALGDPLLRQVSQYALHVLIVAAGLVGVLQPAGQVLPRGGLDHHIIAGFIYDGLIEVEEDEEAFVRTDAS